MVSTFKLAPEPRLIAHEVRYYIYIYIYIVIYVIYNNMGASAMVQC